MCRFIETLAHIHGHYPLLDWHQKRVNETFANFYPEKKAPPLLNFLPYLPDEHLLKIRVIYDEAIRSVTYEPYLRKFPASMRVLHADTLDYNYKYEDRSEIQKLFGNSDQFDEILIVQNNQITDCSYANVCFWRKDQWITPDTYLLNGVMRQKLLNEGVIQEEKISVDQLKQFTYLSLINALNEPGDIVIPTENILQF